MFIIMPIIVGTDVLINNGSRGSVRIFSLLEALSFMVLVTSLSFIT